MIPRNRFGATVGSLLLAAGLAVALVVPASGAIRYADPAALQETIERLQDGGHEESARIADGPVLGEGDEGARVEAVVRRLERAGYLSSDFEGRAYDGRVAEAVEAFQEDRGLKVDGLVGPRTRAALNESLRDRLPELRVNLEGQKEFFSRAPERYVLVNIPDARLVYVEQGKVALEMDVVVGQEGWGTPTLEESIESVVVNPDWDVPPAIVAEEVAPKVAEDPDYLESNDMAVYRSWEEGAPTVDPATIDWASVTEDSWTYRLRQRPGPKNPLGRVKIAFPNDEDIYLHGTPHEQLFSKDRRGLSHGCIRMEKPVALAGRLLELGTEGWDTKRLREAIGTGERQALPLDPTVPIHLVYWTAFVDSQGELQLRPDLYDRMAKDTGEGSRVGSD